jgi:hypothetical protein
VLASMDTPFPCDSTVNGVSVFCCTSGEDAGTDPVRGGLGDRILPSVTGACPTDVRSTGFWSGDGTGAGLPTIEPGAGAGAIETGADPMDCDTSKGTLLDRVSVLLGEGDVTSAGD